MNRYLFDTGFLTLALSKNLPEKWSKPWSEIKTKQRVGYVIEPIIAETYYQLMNKGIDKNKANDFIMQIKSIVNILHLKDAHSFEAGICHKRFKALSLVDCFILAVAYRERLKIFTTDESLKISADDKNVLCDYIRYSKKN